MNSAVTENFLVISDERIMGFTHIKHISSSNIQDKQTIKHYFHTPKWLFLPISAVLEASLRQNLTIDTLCMVSITFIVHYGTLTFDFLTQKKPTEFVLFLISL